MEYKKVWLRIFKHSAAFHYISLLRQDFLFFMLRSFCIICISYWLRFRFFSAHGTRQAA